MEKRLTSSVRIRNKPKTGNHMLSLVITENAMQMYTCQPSCLQSSAKKHSDVCTMQTDACELDVIFTTHFAALDVSLGFVLTSEAYNSDWTTRRKKKAALNRMEDFLWLSVWPEKRKCQQLRFYDMKCQPPHLYSFTQQLYACQSDQCLSYTQDQI